MVALLRENLGPFYVASKQSAWRIPFLENELWGKITNLLLEDDVQKGRSNTVKQAYFQKEDTISSWYLVNKTVREEGIQIDRQYRISTLVQAKAPIGSHSGSLSMDQRLIDCHQDRESLTSSAPSSAHPESPSKRTWLLLA